jgi:outer membrane murein-binding lipoprotein Lpp
MVDQTAVNLIISNIGALSTKIEDVQKDVGKTREEVSKISGCIVGQERCTEIMGKLNAQIQAVQLVCTRNETEKGALAETIAGNHETLVSRVDKLENDKILNDLEPRIRCLEDKEIIVDYQKGLVNLGLKTVTSSPLLGGIMALLVAIATGVYWGRINDMIALYGVHITLIIIASIAIILALSWKGRRKMAQAIDYGKTKGILTI